MYEVRTYRQRMGEDKHSFVVCYRETDLWISMSPEAYRAGMEDRVYQEVVALRDALESYISDRRDFYTSLVPIPEDRSGPPIVREMIQAAVRAGVGPMAAVAGAFSGHIGRMLESEYGLTNLVVENGGDIYINSDNVFVSSIFAGASPLSNRLGLVIPPDMFPLGICTSSGTVGPSLSFGKADAVTVCCKNTATADAFATSLANRVQTEDDIPWVLEESEKYPEIISVVIIKNDKTGVRGQFEITAVTETKKVAPLSATL